MNADLEKTLDELGPSYRDMVLEMKAAPEAEPAGRTFAPFGASAQRSTSSRVPYLVAAALVALVALAVVVRSAFVPAGAVASARGNPYTLAYGGASESAVDEMLRTQRPDGSWANDFITRQNAAALRGVASASVAYRRAVRYLRSKGLSPLSPDELRERGALAAKAQARI